ncbi:MAG TPA: hypothetical protein VHF47_11815 [Acidimicrobiales bacterium]|nr:hypothetical protein [Acidimicrobiales bacterium]
MIASDAAGAGSPTSGRMWFTLDRPPNLPDQLSPATGVVGKAPPTLSARYNHVDPGNSSGQIVFKLMNAADTVLSEAYSSSVCKGCTATHTPTGLPDGLYKWQAVAYDGGGTGNPNAFSSATTPRTFRVDSVAPPAPDVSSSSHPFGDIWYSGRRFQASWPLPSDASGIAGYSVVVDQNPATTPSESVNHSDRTYSTPTDLSDGQHHAHVRAVDNAGNWSQPRHFGFKVDGSTPGAPSITVTGDPDTTTSYPDPAAWIPFDDLRFAWSGGNTASGTGGWSFHLDQQSSSTPDDTPEGTLNWQPFPNLTDGEHTLHVKQKNNAGTWGSSAHRTVRIDATPPLAPTVSSTTHAETNRWYSNANASAIWSAADLAPIDGYSWVLDQSPDTVPDEASEGTDTSASRSGLEDGVHYLHVRARNGAGLWGATTHFPIRVDAVVEASSISSSSHPSQTSWSVYDDVDLAWSAPAQSQSGVLGWSYSFNGTDPDCVSEGPSTTRSYADMPDGTYVFRLRALDGLERCSAVTSYTVNIDTSAPTIASTSSPTHPLEKAFYDNADAEVRWAASDTAPINGYSWAIDRTPNTTPDTVSEGMATVATTSGLSDGEWVFHLRARNATGTWGPAVHRTVRIDTTAPGSPPVTSSSHPSSTTWYRNDEPSFGFATVDDSEVDGYSYVLDQSPSTVPDTTSEGTTTTTQYTDLADGVHTFHVRARNRLGMWGEPSHYTVRIDTLNGAPTVTSPTHPDPSAWYSTGTPELQWSGTYPSGVVGWSYTLDQSPVTVPDTTSEGTGTTKGYAGLAAGTHYFHLVALTEAGPTEAAHFPVRVDTSAPPAPPVSSTTHPSTTTWYPNASGTASFATMDTAPVNGYSVVVDRSPDTTPATMASTTSATVDFTLPDDVNYLHVRARNAAGLWGPTTHFAVRVDTTAPDVPGVSSSTHPSQTTWYPNDDPSFDLTATDISGVAGFSYVLDDMAVTDPDTTSEGSETRIAFSDLPDKPQYLHVRVRNGAGLWSGTEHFEVRIDDTAPAAPTMSSPTHPSQTAWSMSADATVRFPAADTAPVDGYSWMVDQSPSTTPDDVSEGTDSFATVTPGEGIYYLHARVRNASGLWGRPSHYALKTDAVAAAPSLASSSHPDQTTWYPSRTVAMGWTASEESGIAGYAVSVTPNVASDPGTVVNASGTSTQLELVEDRVWVVNMRSKTNSGAWSLPTAYVLNVDADPPATPVASSTSHPDPSRWYPNNDADFVFSTSDISGIDGYSIVADQSATTEPDDMVDTRSTSHHVADLPDGAHTLHVKARNAAGVWSATRHIRILVDTTPPTVVTSWTSPDSADVGETVAMAADWDASASPVRGLFCKSEEFNGSTCSAGEWTPATPATGESPSVATYTTTANDVGQQTYYAIMCDEAGLCSEPRAGGFLVVPPGGEHDGDVVVAAGYTRGKRDELDYFPDKWRPNWEPKRWFYEEGFPAKAKGPVEAALNDWQGLTGNRVGLRFTLDKSRLAAHGWDSDDVEETCNDFKEGKYDHLPETSGLTPNADRHFPNVVAWKNISALGRVQHCIDSTGLDDGLIVGVVMILDEKPPDSTRWWYPADGELAQSHQYSIRAAAQHEAGHWFGFYGLYKDGHFNPSDEEVCGGTHETHSTMCSPLPPETHFMESLHHEDIRAFRKGYERGYWLVASDGGVFSFGDARFHGSMGCCPLNSPMVGMAEHPSHEGYYTVAADGGIFTFPPNNPRVKFYGSMGGTRLNKPIIGMAVHPTGLGYWLVAADGGIFTFPDKTSTVKFYGSTGGQHIGTTIVGMAPTPDGNGYWLVGANGRVFAFGDAVKKGDLVGKADTATVVGIAPTQSGGGYWIAEANGNVWNFGNAADWGDALGQYVHNRFVAISPTRSGRGYLLFGNWHPPGERPRTVIRRFGDAPYFGRVIGDINLPIVGGVSRGWDG